MDWHHPIPGLPDVLTGPVLNRTLGYEPDAIAVLLRGSYATGEADDGSDLDLTVITPGAPQVPYHGWFEDRGDRMLAISVSAKPLADWLAKREVPAAWSLGFPACDVARYLWHTDEARSALGDDPSALRPPGAPCLEDFVNNAVKVRRAEEGPDELTVRVHARFVAEYAVSLLLGLNEPRVVTDTVKAITAVFELETVPLHFRTDFAVCFGLHPAAVEEVAGATRRLARELLAFLREHAFDVDPQPGANELLRDGAFERYLGA